MFSRETKFSTTVCAADFAAAMASLYISAGIAGMLGIGTFFNDQHGNLYAYAYLFAPILITLYFVFGQYLLKNFGVNRRRFLVLLFISCLAGILTIIFMQVFGLAASRTSRAFDPTAIYIGAALILPFFAAGCRIVVKNWIRHRSRNGARKLAIVGDQDWIEQIGGAMREKEVCDYVIGAVCLPERRESGGHEADGPDQQYRSYGSVEELLNNEEIDVLAFDRHFELAGDSATQRPVIQRLFAGLEVTTPDEIYKKLTNRYPNGVITSESLAKLLSCEGDQGRWYRRCKRLLDIVLSVVFLVIAAIPMAIIALIVKLDSPGPVLFVQERLGYRRRPFRCIKFRTMTEDAERITGPTWASANDPRITRSGHILRHLRLDELPQLLNVLKGEMSLVGPRPIRDHAADLIAEKLSCYDLRFLVPPGLTGWSQVRLGYAGSETEQELKFGYDLYYMEHRSLAFDLLVMVQTLRTLLKV